MNPTEIQQIVDRLYAQASDLRIQENLVPYAECNEMAAGIIDRLHASLATAREAQDFSCLRCGDGNTPLYCLNCAGDLLRVELAAAREVLPKCLAMARAWESTDGDPAVELIDEIKAALAAIQKEGEK